MCVQLQNGEGGQGCIGTVLNIYPLQLSSLSSIQGTREGRSFYNWSVKMCRTEQQARDQLKKYSVEFYWDLALSQAIVEAEDD